MLDEREEMKRLDETLQAELEAWTTAFKEEAKQREKERMKDFEAQVQAQLIDPDKLKKYVEAMDGKFEEARKEPPPRDEKAQEAALREAQEIMLSDQSSAWFTPSTPCQPNMVIDGYSSSNTWKSSDPMFFGGAKAQDTYIKLQNQFRCRLEAGGGLTTSPLMAQAWALSILRFKIPGKHIPYGKIEVTPYLNIHGFGGVKGGLSGPLNPGCGAWAKINVQSRMGQGSPYPCVKNIAPYTKPHTLWQQHSPATKAPYGKHNIKYTGFVPQAKVVGDVEAGIDVYIDVWVELMCVTVGGWASALLDFDSNWEFIEVIDVCMKVLAQYPQYVAIAALLPLWQRWPTISPELIKELTKKK